MMNKPVEHYIVRPNLTLGDWSYEYSNGDKVDDCNSYDRDIKKLSISIDSLRETLLTLQNSIKNISTDDNTDSDQLDLIIQNAINHYVYDSSYLKTIINQTVSDNQDIEDLKLKIQSIDILELANIGSRFNGIDESIIGLDNLIGEVSDNINRHVTNLDIHVTPTDKERWNENNTPISGILIHYNELAKKLEITV